MDWKWRLAITNRITNNTTPASRCQPKFLHLGEMGGKRRTLDRIGQNRLQFFQISSTGRRGGGPLRLLPPCA
ncbi:hypothetical protein HMPREF0372_03444 [Flavonifractor plautii ATCC 29863]|uniref:Uncharacterized protein n=1 Tax=Flavonifractor plautii ATCC 29863 TaxID=411475 RepID=G9YV79_FLAPL|nr:hypothetical protein HMPREF0372_03444 [Flavonifractor plautii ATCC 29863]